MKDENLFYLVCAWDTYYPSEGVRNIKLVTYDYEEALAEVERLKNDESYDRVGIYDSNGLPWSIVKKLKEI